MALKEFHTDVDLKGRLLLGGSAGAVGQVPVSQGAGSPPVWGTLTGVSSFSAGTTGLTPSTSTTGAVTLAGILAVANGGTGTSTSTGSGSVVLSTSPSLTTPALGTPSSGTLTNCTGYTFANIASKPTTLSGYGITDAQALDADLTAIAGLAGTSGLLRKTAANTWSLDTASYLTGNQSITMSGDVTGAGATSIAVTLANSGVTAGTYTKLTVDAKGRATAGASLAASDIPDLSLEKIPDAWVKRSVRVATTANITLSGTQTIDGVPVVAGDRVLVKNQTNASQNGIYVVSATAWARSVDADTVSELAGSCVNVDSGATNGGLRFDTDLKTTDTLGTTSVIWYQVLDAASANSTAATIAMNGTQAAGTSGLYARADHVHPTDSSRAPIASPTFTGTPAAPTAVVGTNTTQLATTAFVNAEIANDAPSKTGTGASGTWGISITGSAGSVAWSGITGEPTTLAGYGITDAASSTHTHGNISNAGAIGTTSGLPIITTTSGVLTAGSFGTAAGTFCQGNDSRLSNQRIPTDGSVTTAKLASVIAPTVSSINGGPISGARNRIINGDMRIDQRNAGAAVTPGLNVYTIDRWVSLSTQGSKFTFQQNAGSIEPPTGFKNYLGATTASAYSVGASDYFALAQHIEGFNVADLDWGTANAQTVTLSFWVRSSLTGTFNVNFANDYTRGYAATYVITAANTWEKKTLTIPGDTTGTWNASNGAGLRILWNLGSGSSIQQPVGTWGAWVGPGAAGSVSVVGTNGATFYLTGVQLEAGTVATPFERRSYGQELALCQRYYQAIYGASTGQPYLARNNAGGANQGPGLTVHFKVPMRAAPTATRVGTWTTINVGQPAANAATTEAAFLYADSIYSGDCYYMATSSSVGYTFSSEL